MKTLFILWRNLHDDTSYGENFLQAQRELFINKTNEELISISKILCQKGALKHLPYEYAIYLAADTEEWKYSKSWQVIYKGTIKNYREFLIAVILMLHRIETPMERCKFTVELALKMKNVNPYEADKFLNDIANQAFYSFK